MNPVFEIANFQRGDQFVKSLPTLLLVGGFHGDEAVGTYSLYYLIQYIRDYYLLSDYLANLLENIRLLVVPMSNVNGYFN